MAAPPPTAFAWGQFIHRRRSAAKATPAHVSRRSARCCWMADDASASSSPIWPTPPQTISTRALATKPSQMWICIYSVERQLQREYLPHNKNPLSRYQERGYACSLCQSPVRVGGLRGFAVRNPLRRGFNRPPPRYRTNKLLAPTPAC